MPYVSHGNQGKITRLNEQKHRVPLWYETGSCPAKKVPDEQQVTSDRSQSWEPRG